MNIKAYSEKASKRLAHIQSHIGGAQLQNERAIYNIVNGLGNPIACALGLSSQALANGMRAWFEYHDLHAMQQWCYVAAKLDQFWYQLEESTVSPGAKMLQLLKPLLSNNDTLIKWFASYDSAFDMKRVENHKTHDFWAYQAVVAVFGDWPRLIARCEKVINDTPGSSALQKYRMDHHFYLALAQGNLAGMEEVLAQIVSPKAVRGRTNDESGFTEDLISTPAVIYSKIAWLHGYQVKVDSPYVPVEWLSMEPLAQYDKHYDFLKS